MRWFNRKPPGDLLKRKRQRGRHRLTDIDVDEISLVKRSANRRTFTLLKSADHDERSTFLAELRALPPSEKAVAREMVLLERELPGAMQALATAFEDESSSETTEEEVQMSDDGDAVARYVEKAMVQPYLTPLELEALDATEGSAAGTRISQEGNLVIQGRKRELWAQDPTRQEREVLRKVMNSSIGALCMAAETVYKGRAANLREAVRKMADESPDFLAELARRHVAGR